VQRKFHDEYVDKGPELARQALELSAASTASRPAIGGRQPAERPAVRQAVPVPCCSSAAMARGDAEAGTRVGQTSLLPSATLVRVETNSGTIVTTASWRSTTTLLNAH
jgi:hypothetical protein